MRNTPHSWLIWICIASCFSIVALLLTGCASTPSTINEDGITRTMTEAEQQAKDLIGKKASLSELSATNGRKICEVLRGKNNTQLNIDAKVSVVQFDRITSFDLVLTEPDSELAKSVFFANALDLVVPEPPSGTIPGRQLWSVHTVNPIDEYDAYIATYDQIFNEEESSMVYTFNDDAVNPYRELTPIPIGSFDEDHVLETLKDILRNFSIPDVSPYSVVRNDSNIEIAAVPQFTTLPVVPPDKRTHYFHYEAYGNEYGLFRLLVDPYVQPDNITPIDALISVEQAIKIVEKNLGTTLIPYLEKTIDGITLCHHYRFDQSTGRYRAHPVWYFHMQEDPPRYVDFGVDYGEQTRTDFTRYTSSFAVDAVTGLLCAVTEEEVWDDNDD